MRIGKGLVMLHPCIMCHICVLYKCIQFFYYNLFRATSCLCVLSNTNKERKMNWILSIALQLFSSKTQLFLLDR